MRVVLISGKAGHGKDTVASYMKEHLCARGDRVLVAHYADLVKYVCRTFFGWNGEKDEAGRALLQHVGTDVVRSHDQDFWVRFLSEILKCFSDEWDYVLIPDTRFPNEIDGMNDAGFKTIHMRVFNPNKESALSKEQQEHASETSLDGVSPNMFYINRGTLDDIRDGMQNTCELIDSLFKEKENGR